MRILFITSTRVGDAVLSTGLLGHLAERWPEARIRVACGPLPAPLFAAAPGIERVLALRKRSHGRHWLDLWRACVGIRWDLIVNLRDTPVALLLRARRRVTYRGDPGPVHKVVQLGRLLGLDPPPAPRLWPTAAEQAEAARLVPAGAPVLGLGPTTPFTGKEWPGERFAALAQRLTGPDGPLPGGRVAVFSAPAERERALAAAAGIPAERLVDLAGRLALPLAGACLARCRLFVGNDSGLMHMAAAAGAPTLGLFGPSRDEHYAPWGDRAAVIRTPQRYAELSAVPFRADRRTRMGGLEVAAVAQAARDLVGRTGG